MSKKPRYRVTNWKDYNRALISRGDFTLWINDEILDQWYWQGRCEKSGNPLVYSDLAIQCALSVRMLWHMPLRMTQGFLSSIFKAVGFNIGAPDYSTISRRAVKLTIEINRTPAAPNQEAHRIIVIDSTGLKVFGEGEWKMRSHGKSKRRTWRKVHFAIDRKTHVITALQVTQCNRHDCEETEALMAETGPSDQVIADGAYDNQKSYDAIDAKGARALIPPRSGAALSHTTAQKEISWGMVRRNANIHGVWKLGREEWKRCSGYHCRSIAETGIGRFKTIFGSGLKSREFNRQVSEARIKARILNQLTMLGMPQSVRVR